MDSGCIFCRIISGDAPAEILYHDGAVTAFVDTHPVTPTHILVVPNQHITSLNECTSEDEAMLGKLIMVARRISADFQLRSSGYRLVINTGQDAGQSVFHLHLHLLGGRRMPFHFRESNS